MNQFPPDDPLKQFLRRHRPTPPPASPELEAQIMRSVEEVRVAAQPARRPISIRRRQIWLVSSAFAASLLVAIVSYRMVQNNSKTVEANNLETFLENNWDGLYVSDGVASDSTGLDWLTSTDSTLQPTADPVQQTNQTLDMADS